MNPREKLHTELRTGLTTGTCAAAVAKASAYMLANQCIIQHVSITLPSGKVVVLELEGSTFSKTKAFCSTIKDAGDDPDITNGAKIIAYAEINTSDTVNIIAGEGIGKVTKPGLAVEVGKAAINPVPLKMIKESVQEVVTNNQGINITISIPEGVELAKKTFNPKLGIEGGISVLGTTGIVKPMSEESLKDSLVLTLKQLASQGINKAILAPGNYGKAFSKENFSYDEDKVVLTSNYVGFMLEQAVRLKFTKLVLAGHIGKLVKIAGGIFNTHSRVADARNEILASHYFNYSSDTHAFKQIMNSNTTEEAVNYISDNLFWALLANKIKERAEKHIYDEAQVEVALFSQQKGFLSGSSGAIELIEEIVNEQ